MLKAFPVLDPSAERPPYNVLAIDVMGQQHLVARIQDHAGYADNKAIAKQPQQPPSPTTWYDLPQCREKRFESGHHICTPHTYARGIVHHPGRVVKTRGPNRPLLLPSGTQSNSVQSTRSQPGLSQALRPTLTTSTQLPFSLMRTTSAVKSVLVPQAAHELSRCDPTP